MLGLAHSIFHGVRGSRWQVRRADFEPMGPPLTPEIAGDALLELMQAEAATVGPSYPLTGAGLQKLP